MNIRFKPQQPKTPKMQTTTLWDFPSQHYGEDMQGDADYVGATPSYVIWNLLHRYTKPGAVVVDPMCGSGTTMDVCKDLERQGLGFDVAPSRPDINQADARHLPLEDDSVDFAFVDPPYSTHIKYSGDQQCIGELDARGGGYYEAMEEVIADLYRVLKPGAYFALYVSDSQAKNKSFCPIGFELFLRMTKLFEPVDVVAVTRHNKSLKRNHWHTSAIEGNFYLRGFNYLFVVRKRPLDAEETHKHEDAGILSKLFIAASKANPGEVVTPEKFGHLLDQEKDRLQGHLSKKQQKKLGRASRPTEEHRPSQIMARGEQPDRSERPKRLAQADEGSTFDRTDRPARAAKPSWKERPNRDAPSDRNDKPTRAAKPDWKERPNRDAPSDRNDKPTRAAKPSWKERPNREAPSDRNDKPIRAAKPSWKERPNREAKADRGAKPDWNDRPKRHAKADRSDKPGIIQSNRPPQSDTGRRERSDRGGSERRKPRSHETPRTDRPVSSVIAPKKSNDRKGSHGSRPVDR